MSRLKAALEREYEASTESPVKVFNPKNLETVTFHFRGEKMAKVGYPGILLALNCSENIVAVYTVMHK